MFYHNFIQLFKHLLSVFYGILRSICGHKAQKNPANPLFIRVCGKLYLFVLYSSRALWGEVVKDSVYSFYFTGDADYDSIQDVVWDTLYCGCHGISCVDCTDDNRPVKASLLVSYAC